MKLENIRTEIALSDFEKGAIPFHNKGMHALRERSLLLLYVWDSDKLPYARMGNKLIQCSHSKNLSIQSQQHLTHVLTPLPEAAAIDASNNLIVRPPFRDMLVALGFQLLDPCHFISGSAVVTCYLCLNYYSRMNLIWNAEIWRLPKSRYSLGALCLSECYAVFSQVILNCVFHHLTDQF